MSKLFVIEGTDCSGKETQTKLLLKNLNTLGIKTFSFSFPNYLSPTGKIVGGPYLGKEEISKGYFSEGASNVSPLVSSLYFAADRLYNSKIIIDKLKEGYVVILDRYTTSNMAHQGAKILDKEKRLVFFNKLKYLEEEILELPKIDKVFFLHVPFDAGSKLRSKRKNLDEHEKDVNHLKLSEKVYLELSEIYNFKTINCLKDGSIDSIENINKRLLESVLDEIK